MQSGQSMRTPSRNDGDPNGRSAKTLLPFFAAVLFVMAAFSSYAQAGDTVLIVVNANLYTGGITSEVQRLKADLEAENYTAKIKEWPSSGTSSLDLWTYLNSEYTDATQTLRGAILIGSLPKPQAGGIYNELLFWNMNEYQTTSSHVASLHIWVSRINVDHTTYGSEVTLMRRALDANHAYRTGQSRLPFTAYRYKNPEWWNNHNHLGRVWPVVEQRGYDVNDLRFMPERDDLGDVAGADCMVKGGELFEEESHGEYNSYMYDYGMVNKDVVHRNLVQTRVCLIGSCLTGVYGGIANEHLFTRGGGNILSISHTEISYVGETVISANTGFLDLLAAGMTWGDALVQNWSLGGRSYTTLFGDLSIRPMASVSANAMPVMTSWSPVSAVYEAPFTAVFDAEVTTASGSSVALVEYFCTGYNRGRNTPTYSGPPAAYTYTYTTPGTYTVRIEVTDEYQARTWREATFLVVEPATSYRAPENPSNVTQGMAYAYYEGSWSALPDFDSLTPVASGALENFLISGRARDENFGFQYTGYIEVPTRGVYAFHTTSDDGSKLYIGSTLVVDNDGLHGMQERSGTIALEAGKHAIRLTYFQAGGGLGLEVRWQGPDLAKQLIPNASLWRDDVNLAPAAHAQHVITPPNTPAAITLSGHDPEGAALSYTIVTPPAHGALSGTLPDITYTPAAKYQGPDSFTFKVNDGHLDSPPAEVSLLVALVPAHHSFESPVLASGGFQYTPSGSGWTFSSSAGLAANGSPWFVPNAPDGTQACFLQMTGHSVSQSMTFPADGTYTITFSAVGRSGYGSMPLQVRVGGTEVLALTEAQIGTTAWTRFTSNPFTVSAGAHTIAFVNGTLSGDRATVIDDVRLVVDFSVNRPPVADAQSVTTDQDTPLAITLTGSDADGDPLTFTVVTGPAYGTLSGTAPNVTYTPESGYAGADSFTFTVNDGTEDSEAATVWITVVAPVVITPAYAKRADGYTVATFAGGSGQWTIPEGVTSLEVLVVGGGGGGGARNTFSNAGAGGGGAGGLVYIPDYSVSGGSVLIEVGRGGAGGTGGNVSGTNGTNSAFGELTALGGGGGSGGNVIGHAGGSGGGSRIDSLTGGAGQQPGQPGLSGEFGHGHNGGAVNQSAGSSAGGGGGAQAAGSGITGGDGKTIGITGTAVAYAGGGGGGGAQSATPGNGGAGGGGRGGNDGTAATAGTVNMGGGGGGGNNDRAGARGGDGVVIVAYLPATYDAWLDGYLFEAGADTSPAGSATNDGVSNLVKFTLGLDPAVPLASSPFVVETATEEGSSFVRIGFPRNPAAAGVQIEALSAGVLDHPGAWSTDTVEIVTDTADFFSVRDTVPLEAGGPRYLKLRFVLP